MTRDKLTLRLALRLTRPRITALLTLAFITAGRTNVSSTESVTLSTYYPAPTGVYTQIITNNQTWFAQNGGTVTIGSANTPAGNVLLLVDGNHAGRGDAVFQKVAVNSQTVPGAVPVQVNAAGVAGPHLVSISPGGGQMQMTQSGGVALLHPGSGALGLSTNGTELMYVNGSGRVGIFGNAAPASELDVPSGASLSVGGACSFYYVGPGNVQCPAGQYATMHPGLYSDLGSNGSEPGDPNSTLGDPSGPPDSDDTDRGRPNGCSGPAATLGPAGGSCAAMYCCTIPPGSTAYAF